MRLDCWMLAMFAGLLAAGCAAEDEFVDEMPDDLPAGMSDTDAPTTTTGSTASATTDPTNVTDTSGFDEGTTTGGMSGCQSSMDCLGNDVCVASWDPETQTHGEPECSFSCIPNLDDSQWCADASACCDADAICTGRGYCVVPQEPSADASSGGGDGTSTGDGSGSTGGGDGTTGGGQ